MTSMTHHQAQLGDFSACFPRQLHHFVNENNWQVVNHEPTEIFKIVGSLRTTCAR
jgi:hypothetical protein